MGHLVWPFLCANLSRFTSLIAEYRTAKTETQANNVGRVKMPRYWAVPVHCDGLYKWCFETWATAFVSQIDPTPLLYTLAGSCRFGRVFKCMHTFLCLLFHFICANENVFTEKSFTWSNWSSIFQYWRNSDIVRHLLFDIWCGINGRYYFPVNKVVRCYFWLRMQRFI